MPESAPELHTIEGRPIGDRVFKGLLTLLAATLPVLLLVLAYGLYHGAAPAIERYGLGFLSGSTWDPVMEEFGAFPLIIGTLVCAGLALLIAVPLSLGVAI